MHTSAKTTSAQSKSFFSLLIPYAGSLIIIFGVLRLYHYYDYFQVNIFNFISFGEILSLFVESVREPVYLFLVIAIIFLLARSLYELLPPGIKKYGRRKLAQAKKEITEPVSYASKVKRLSSGIMMFTVAGSTIFYHIAITKPITDVVAAASLTLSLLLAGIIAWFWTRKNRTAVFIKLLPVVPLFLYVFFITYRDLAEVTKGKKYLNTQIVLKDSTVLTSDSTTYYIGKTENFVFIHHEAGNFTEIIPAGEIAKYHLRKKRFNLFQVFSIDRSKLPGCPPNSVAVFP